jgi:AcrR family transcriptional regulator
VASPLKGRRADYARATHEAIHSAARDLFVAKGYFGTRVEDIARAARVSPATVYAVGGGKHGLLRELIQEGTRDRHVTDVTQGIEAVTNPGELLRLLVDARSLRFERWSDLVRQVMAAAPQDDAVRESLELANAAIRAGLARAAQRLADMQALPRGLTVAQATDTLWYFLGNASYFTLTDDLHWPLSRASDWIYQQLLRTLLDQGRS